ncbi:AAC(3) family N-acetyltransferase (plasmid) [Haloferacaceae archaeon DSL9]
MTTRKKFRNKPVGSVSESTFDSILDRYADDSAVFVHVGLRSINAAFDGNPYEFLLGRLDDRFETILNPGFTPSFRKDDGGVYHKRYSLPRFGTFSKLFFEDADYRTDDATNSILVRGTYRFDDCDHHDTWSPDGCFGKLAADDIRYLAVGTDWITASQLHYLESILEVPYVRTASYDGVIYYDETTHEPITQRSHEYVRQITWNRARIADDLDRDGVLDRYNLNGLRLFSFTARDLADALTPRIERDPYYLVT